MYIANAKCKIIKRYMLMHNSVQEDYFRIPEQIGQRKILKKDYNVTKNLLQQLLVHILDLIPKAKCV